MTRPHLGRIKTAIKRTQKTFSAQEVHKAACEAGLGRLNHQFLDGEFVALPLEVWRDYLSWSKVSEFQYVATKRDCENFSIALVGEAALRLGVNGMGLVGDISGRHCYVCLLVLEGDKLKVQCVEPQTDSLVTIGSKHSNSEAYKGEEGFVLWS